MMNTYRYATRAILTLCFFTVTIISTVSGEVIHFGSNMEYVPDEVSQRDYISDEDLLKVVEDIEQQQSGGGAGEVIHFGSNMEYVPDGVLQRDYISDEDLLKVVEDIEQQQSGGGAGESGEESSEGFF